MSAIAVLAFIGYKITHYSRNGKVHLHFSISFFSIALIIHGKFSNFAALKQISMGFVLDYIVKTSDKRVSSYDTLKRFIDEREQDTFGEFEDHSSSDVVMDSHDKFAEDQPLKSNYRKTPLSDIHKFHNKSRFKYFLDGSRHVYKVGDVLIAGTVYPVVAGQIIIGCCITLRTVRCRHLFFPHEIPSFIWGAQPRPTLYRSTLEYEIHSCGAGGLKCHKRLYRQRNIFFLQGFWKQ